MGVKLRLVTGNVKGIPHDQSGSCGPQRLLQVRAEMNINLYVRLTAPTLGYRLVPLEYQNVRTEL